VKSNPAFAVGWNVFTVTMTWSVAVHPAEFVVVTVYVVVTNGFAVGCAAVAELSPVVGVQAYVFPATAAVPITAPVGFWIQFFVTSGPALDIGVESTFTVIWLLLELHPKPFVTIRQYVPANDVVVQAVVVPLHHK
jgi:hypothetical protein